MDTSLTFLCTASASFPTGETSPSIPLSFHMTGRTKGFNANQIMSFHVFIFLNGCFLYLKSKTFLPRLTRPCAMGLCHPAPRVTFYTPDPELISDALICQIHTRLGDFLLLSPLSATFCSALFCFVNRLYF